MQFVAGTLPDNRERERFIQVIVLVELAPTMYNHSTDSTILYEKNSRVQLPMYLVLNHNRGKPGYWPLDLQADHKFLR